MHFAFSSDSSKKCLCFRERETSGMAKSHPSVTVQPSLFDIFYEEFLTQFMAASSDPAEISTDFMKLKTDLERAEFLTRLPFIRDFEIKNKAGLKCIEKAVKYREEGNKLFQVLENFLKYFDPHTFV